MSCGHDRRCAASGDTVAMIPVVTGQKTPLITPSGTAAKVTVDERSGKVNEWVFRACFIDPFQGTVTGKFAVNGLMAKTVVIYTDASNDYSKGFAKSLQEEFTKRGYRYRYG
ncbi:type 1 periplasmic-binding domain-containing protein [Effusibacillus pohliae]|uniref:ABC transporter substrate-binding protein n=1 Tax=Effusibacillus pohliae TaxID=232270 RepID=UPI0012E9B462|nr:ABC transporter substrate-binding protein [Effusibacillus pohliae]